jgi:hypothetical protein
VREKINETKIFAAKFVGRNYKETYGGWKSILIQLREKS